MRHAGRPGRGPIRSGVPILPAFDGDRFTPLAESVQRLVDRIQRDHGETPTYIPVDFFHGGMPLAPLEGLQDRHPLGGDAKAPGAQAASDGVLGSRRDLLRGGFTHGDKLFSRNGFYVIPL